MIKCIITLLKLLTIIFTCLCKCISHIFLNFIIMILTKSLIFQKFEITYFSRINLRIKNLVCYSPNKEVKICFNVL